MITETDVMDVAERWVRAACKHRAAEIDAAACGSPRDYDKMHEAERAADQARYEFELVLKQALRR